MKTSSRGASWHFGSLSRVRSMHTLTKARITTQPLRSVAALPPGKAPSRVRSFFTSKPGFSGSIASMSISQPQHERTLPAWFARGGTSNGLVLLRTELPAEEHWPSMFPAAMGSPDIYGRQLNGMGSGISSTSKIIVLGPPTRDDVDVDYTFVQVGIREGELDMAGNCGNMSSLIGPMAWDKGMISKERAEAMVEEDAHGVKWARVRFLNTNTSKVLESQFKVEGQPLRYCPRGDYAMDGVPGTGSKITLSFLDPAGAKTGKALPTGKPRDTINLPDGRSVEASLVDVSNPGVFVRAQDMLALSGKDTDAAAEALRLLNPATIEADENLKRVLEEVRQAGTSMMGLDPKIASVPKIVMLLPQNSKEHVDVKCLALSMGQAHKAVPLTLALCLGAACQMEGSTAWSMLSAKAKTGNATEASTSGSVETKVVTIGHASGKLDIGISLKDGEIVSAELLRTARVLMKGEILY